MVWDQGLWGQGLVMAPRQGEECVGWWVQCQELGDHSQSSTGDGEAELCSKENAKEEKFQAVQTLQGTLRTPCWLIFFFFHKNL